jgi:hypothetical protein
MSAQPLPVSPEQRKERQEAAGSIRPLLEMLHEPLWASILIDWTRLYDGMEQYLYPEEDPVMEVRNLLQCHVDTGQALEPDKFASELADLRFCYCTARRDEDGTRWDPFRDGAFAAWTRGKMVTAWDASEPWPTRDMIQAWLLLRFSRTRTSLN